MYCPLGVNDACELGKDVSQGREEGRGTYMGAFWSSSIVLRHWPVVASHSRL